MCIVKLVSKETGDVTKFDNLLEIANHIKLPNLYWFESNNTYFWEFELEQIFIPEEIESLSKVQTGVAYYVDNKATGEFDYSENANSANTYSIEITYGIEAVDQLLDLLTRIKILDLGKNCKFIVEIGELNN